MNKNRAIFLDRDGVINKEVNYLHRIEDFEFTTNCINGLQLLQSKGYLLFVVTNQAGIGRGYYSESDFEQLNAWMITELSKNGVTITDTRYCPHHPTSGIGNYKIDCECRKPEIGMLTDLIEQYDIDTNQSVFIGDKMSDMDAGLNANINTLVLVKSGHELPENVPAYVTYIYENLAEFAESDVLS